MPEESDYDLDQIKVMTGAEHVRKRPGMYFRDCFEANSLSFLPIAASCHAFDEAVDGHCQSLKIELDQSKFSLSYEAGMSLLTHGSGLPVAEVLLTKLFACAHTKRHREIEGAFCIVPIVAINVASTRCELTSVWQNKKASFVFEEGKTISKTEIVDCLEDDQTQLRFWPDFELLNHLELDYKGVIEHVSRLGDLLPELDICVAEMS
ncbi:MAG: hypothetical protein P1V97_07390 [Planctomycetota bacterium]|nr:hypothetical protein [Planctomycetota bacterium]